MCCRNALFSLIFQQFCLIMTLLKINVFQNLLILLQYWWSGKISEAFSYSLHSGGYKSSYSMTDELCIPTKVEAMKTSCTWLKKGTCIYIPRFCTDLRWVEPWSSGKSTLLPVQRSQFESLVRPVDISKMLFSVPPPFQ